MLIEPMIKLIFQGNVEHLSAFGNRLMQIVGHYADLSHTKESLGAIIIFVVVLFLLKNLFAFLTQWLLAPVRSDVVRNLRNQLYYKVLILPLSFFSEQKKGDVISRAVNDTQEIEVTVLSAFQTAISSLLTVIIYIIALFSISYQLTLFVLILLPIAGGCISLVTRSLRKKSLKSKELLGSLLSHVEETIAGLRIVKGLNAQEHAAGVFEKHNTAFATLQKKLQRRTDLASPMSEFLGVSVVMVILLFGGMLVLKENATLSAPLFITYISLFAMVVNPAKNLGNAAANYRRGMAALDRIYEILDADEVIYNDPQSVKIQSFEHQIEIEDVSFAYDKNIVLQDVSLKIHKGDVVALVGASGAGKSTLADLLPRFYDVMAGTIKLDGVDIRKYDIDSLRSLFALVSQDVVLFNDTIFNNITFGKEGVSLEEVEKAARLANAYDFISSLPDGFQTNVGDRGLTLSGGQRQRISIARAILRNAPILILDEATSAMDTESEKLVQRALDAVMQNRTTLVIAHRLSTIRNATCIVVLDQGRVVETGTHEELLQLNGIYSKLVKINQQ